MARNEWAAEDEELIFDPSEDEPASTNPYQGEDVQQEDMVEADDA